MGLIYKDSGQSPAKGLRTVFLADDGRVFLVTGALPPDLSADPPISANRMREVIMETAAPVPNTPPLAIAPDPVHIQLKEPLA